MGQKRSNARVPRRPTMREVAEAAGVSLKTVSRVVNGEPGVREALVTRVQEVIAQLDYQPDDRARQLRAHGARSHLIGFVQVDVANPFFAAMHRGIEDVARQRRTVVVSGSADESPDEQSALVTALVARRVDGLIIVPSGTAATVLRSEIRHGTAIVCVDRPMPDLPTDVVLSDNRGGARAAVTHLLRHGHERIAFLGDDLGIWTATERLTGYVEALTAAGLGASDHLVVSDVAAEDRAEAAVRRLLAATGPPSALFTSQNFVTMGAVRALAFGSRESCSASTSRPGSCHRGNLFLGRERRRPSIIGNLFRTLDRKGMRNGAQHHMEDLGILTVQSITQPVESLSGGQRQGVAVARAAAFGSRVVIMDEPTAALGVRESRKVLDLIGQVRERGLPIILISHNMPHVCEVADRIHIQRLGRRVAVLTPESHSMSDAVAIMTGAVEPEAA